jgi:hypothetical protein
MRVKAVMRTLPIFLLAASITLPSFAAIEACCANR